MDFQTLSQSDKPRGAADRFTVYLVGGDEYVFCPVRKKAYKVNDKPEEKVRQWWLYRLNEVYGYSFDQMAVEVPVFVGSTEAKKKADIVVYQDTKRKQPRVFVEVKQQKRNGGLEQLKVYMNATGCRVGVWSNGNPPHVYLLRIEPTANQDEPSWRELRNLPAKNQNLADVDTPVLRRDLVPVQDFLSVLRECEDYISAHEGKKPFDELFKVIFAKLFDERANLKNEDSPAHFRVGALEAPDEARQRIVRLFQRAKERWAGVFAPEEDLNLTDDSLAFCVSSLQNAYLLKSEADVLGSAFEVMINPEMKGDKGQYFTPRHVIRMCLEVLDPQDGETFFDPACGSGGFLIGAMDHVYRKIELERDSENEIIENKKDYASQCIFGMDYDRLIAKVAKAYMLVWGDGRANIAVCDALNESQWGSDVVAKFTSGKGKAVNLRQFDLIATNPPFAGDVASEDTLSRYELAYKQSRTGARRRVPRLARDKMFIERCINMLAPGGRMAIVLPRGTLKNYNDESVRRFILQHARIIAVVGLTGDMFKPFTNTKTCVLFLQRRKKPLSNVDDALKDPDIVFAVCEKPGKDKSGRLIIDDSRRVQSDLPDITRFIQANVVYDS
jgi:type I restriction enzyme M protein